MQQQTATPSPRVYPGTRGPSIRQAKNVLPGMTFMVSDDDDAVFVLVQHENVPQDGQVRWAVCVATNGTPDAIGRLFEIRDVALVRLVKQTRVGQYEAV